MTVLAATDFSEAANRAIRVAGREARLRGEALTVAHCIRLEADRTPWWQIFDTRRVDPARLHTRAERRLESTVHAELPRGKRPERIDLRTALDSPADSLRELAAEIAPSLVVIGATGRGSLESAVLGSTAEELIRSLTAPVLTVPGHGDAPPFQKILVPVDFSRCAGMGVAAAIEMTRREEAELLVLHEAKLQSTGVGRPSLGPSSGLERSYRAEFEQKLLAYLRQFDLDGIDLELIVNVQSYDTRTPARAIVLEAQRRSVDLIVMSTHGRRGFRRFVLGSTTLEVLHQMPTPLLTLNARRDDGE